ncbi:MAG: system, galactitol-specific component [Anaerocolumna sp.]|nr:system, galactitol-specific component [Anaerocolumna sp.]
MWAVLKTFFDTFGNYITVPIILFIIARIFKAPVKKAFMSAVLAGVGLKGMAFITSAFGAILSPLVQQIVEATGINLPALDVGWQAVASVAYSTDIGMMFLGVGLLFQVILYLIKWTDIFMPSDLWNNYSIIVWGSMFFQIKQNLFMFDKVNVRPETIKKKIGFLGEPMYIGLIIGLILGIIGNITNLGTMPAWGQIANVAVTCAAVMAIFPKVAGLFASAFTTITDYSRKTLKNSKYGKDREFIISVNDALGYGEAATLTTGLLVIPIAVLLAFILPGNIVVPVMVLPSLPYMVEVPVSLSDGNIVKSTVAASIVFAAKLLMASSWAAVFTEIAVNVGFEVTSGTVLIIGFIMSNCTAGLITYAFLTMNPIVILAVVALYLIFYVLFKKNKTAVWDYLENNAMKYKANSGQAVLQN